MAGQHPTNSCAARIPIHPSLPLPPSLPPGYHVEHHDFPTIPWTRLPQVRKIAPEFYAHLTSYPSWCHVIWRFVFDPAVGAKGVMTYRSERTGGTDGAPAARFLTPASAMPLLRGITPASIH